jgi:ATP-binding cassette subfamily B protein
MVVGRNGERLLYTLRVKIFAQLQRLGLDFYEREMSGRIMTRMTTDVDALSSFLQTGLITMVNSLLTFFGVLDRAAVHQSRSSGCGARHAAGPRRGDRGVPAEVREGLRRGPGEGQRRQRDFAENVAGLRVTQAFRREQVNRDRFGGAAASPPTAIPGCAPSGTSRCTSRSCRRCPPSRARSCCRRHRRGAATARSRRAR